MFIKLTAFHTEKDLYLNADKIESFNGSEGRGTVITPIGSQDDFNVYKVKESPEQIIEMIGEMKK
jgi:uncharacterized protein YlzI (FlbEa/FlbD family)